MSVECPPNDSSLNSLVSQGYEDHSFFDTWDLFKDQTLQYFNRIHARILLIDSARSTSQSLSSRLEKQGHHVVLYMSMEDFLKEDHSKFFDIDMVIIQDNQLRDDFFSRFYLVHESPALTNVPIIVMGAVQDMDIVEKCLNAGAEDFIGVPCNPVILSARIKKTLKVKLAQDYRHFKLRKIASLKQELQANLEKQTHGYAFFDHGGVIQLYNKAFSDYYPLVLQTPVPSLYSLISSSFSDSNACDDLFTDLVRERLRQVEFAVGYWEEEKKNDLMLACHTYHNIDGGIVWIIKDISDSYVREKQLSFMAYHDSLTMLANRKYTEYYLSQLLNDTESAPTSLLFLDLDGFKSINDTYGHTVGDWLLTIVAERLKGCVRHTDLVARLGGDEFCIVMSDMTDRGLVQDFCTRICEQISLPYVRGECSLKIGVSVGIAFAPHDTKDPAELLRKADEAMYRAKQTGRGRFVFYNDLETLAFYHQELPVASGMTIDA